MERLRLFIDFLNSYNDSATIISLNHWYKYKMRTPLMLVGMFYPAKFSVYNVKVVNFNTQSGGIKMKENKSKVMGYSTTHFITSIFAALKVVLPLWLFLNTAYFFWYFAFLHQQHMCIAQYLLWPSLV